MALNPLAEDETRFRGIAALGVLKADIDKLGLLMACGLKDKRLTMSRLATLSRQLDAFFSIFLPYKFSSEIEYEDTYTVFAGGDDLFLIGPWNRIVDLAMDISEHFKSYVCRNKEITISAGIALHKPQTPVPAMARSANEALERSKGLGRNRLTLFGETAEWKVAKELEEVRDTLESWLDQGWLSRVMLYRLNDYIRMAADEARNKERFKELKAIPLPFMECTKWRAFLSYAVERNVASALKGGEREKVVKEVREHLARWLDRYGADLRYPVWSILYDRR
jgi:CRISPR-associated protein Csm1